MREFDLRKFFIGVAVVALVSGTALAAPIVPGGVQFPAVAEPDPVGATLVFSTGPVPFAATTFAGTLRSTVYNNDLTNPFGLNSLTFTYEIINNVGSTDAIGRMTVASFAGFLTDASFVPAPGVVPPTIITRSANGQVMGFDFVSPALAPGQSSAVLVVQTNSTQFAPTLASLINGSTTSAASVAPLVPEPASLSTIALGAITLIRRRRA